MVKVKGGPITKEGKAISLHGIGLYLYSGEDLPITNKISPPKQKITPTAGAMDQFSLEERELLHGIGEEISQLINIGKLTEAKSYFESLSRDEKIAVWSLLNNKTRKSLKSQSI